MPRDILLAPHPAQLADAVDRARDALLRRQKPDGHWVFELEADATIPAEYVLLEHFLDRVDADLQGKIAVYLRSIQGAHGGWPLFHDGAFDLSASTKAYFALKMIGDFPDAPHMARARQAILAAGGAERTNVFTRAQLALYGEVPWHAVPCMPVELVLLPHWFPFHLDKVSYWSRTVIVPLVVLMALRPRARNRRGVHIQELFRTRPAQVRDWIRGPYRSAWGRFFKYLDGVVRTAEPFFPPAIRRRAIDWSVRFVTERLNGEDGLGGIYPAMANTVMMFDTLGYPPTIRTRRSPGRPSASCWWWRKTGHTASPACRRCGTPAWPATRWPRPRAATPPRSPPPAPGYRANRCSMWWATGRFRARTPCPGAGPSSTENAHYPDVDDTAAVGLLLHRHLAEKGDDPALAEAVRRARDWVVGMQGRDGGWGAFDADNNHDYLNHIPFADHGALLDPSTADVTARCVAFLAQAGMAADDPVIARAVSWLRAEQEADGSWFGRWGTNYIYGTWSVLGALNAAGVAHDDPAMRRAVGFLVETQREDGGWGEDNESYAHAPRGRYHRSNPSQTAWALLALMAAGEADHPSVARGIAWLAAQQKPDGEWDEAPYTAVGFPRVFYLRYHGYKLFFPLMALARYRTLRRSNERRVVWGF